MYCSPTCELQSFSRRFKQRLKIVYFGRLHSRSGDKDNPFDIYIYFMWEIMVY